MVDAGYVKELRFDPANGGNSSLQEVFISRAAAQQRAGKNIAFFVYCFVAFQYVFDVYICASSSTMHVFAKLKITTTNM